MTTPTDTWLGVSPLPPLEGADAVAERLLMLAHFGANWSVWGPRRMTYWDAFTDRAKASTFAGPSLSDWWEALTLSLDTAPRNAAEREEVVMLLSCGNDRVVLAALRQRTAVLVLRCRVVAQEWRESRPGRDGLADDDD